MILGSRDADHILCGLWVSPTAGSLRDGCCALGVARSADARPCRGLRDRGTQCCHVPVPRRPGEDQRGRRAGRPKPFKSSRWSIGDSLPKGAIRTATLGDNRRQIFSLRSEAGGRILHGRRWSAARRDRSENKHIKRLVTMNDRRRGSETHVRSLMGIGGGGPESLRNHDKKRQHEKSTWHSSVFSGDVPVGSSTCRQSAVVNGWSRNALPWKDEMVVSLVPNAAVAVTRIGIN